MDPDEVDDPDDRPLNQVRQKMRERTESAGQLWEDWKDWNALPEELQVRIHNLAQTDRNPPPVQLEHRERVAGPRIHSTYEWLTAAKGPEEKAMIAQAIEDGNDPGEVYDSFVESIHYFKGSTGEVEQYGLFNTVFGTGWGTRVDDTGQFVTAYEKDPWKPHMLPEEYRVRQSIWHVTPRTSKDMFSYVNNAARRFGGGGSGSGGGSSSIS